MTKKMIAGVLSVLLSSSSVPFILNASPLVSHAEAEETSLSAETTEATLAATEGTAALEEEGAALRESLDVIVGDIIYINENAYLYDSEGNELRAGSGWNMWIIGVDDENQRFRVDVPKMRNEDNSVYYLLYADLKEDSWYYPDILSHDGSYLGDLNYDKRVDVFDLCLMKRYFIRGWGHPSEKVLADMNGDNDVTVADIVWLQKWLFGIPKP